MIEERLEHLVNNENRTKYTGYSPDTVIALARALGDPQEAIRTVHIAGTNGKGSVAHMLDAIFRSAGYRPGLYTSPHLLRINERILINGIEIEDAAMIRYLDEIEKAAGGARIQGPTYFDVLTLISLLCFRDVGVDIAIMETGLGGRLDSTNIIYPLCSVITDISLDHTGILGNSITDIAAEKAGIIKRGVPLVTSNSGEPVAGVLERMADYVDADARFLGRDFHAEGIRKQGEGQVFDFRSERQGRQKLIRGITIPLAVPVQVKNAALALETSLILQESYPALDQKALLDGLGNVRIPGRMETLSRSPLVLYDPAHNPAAIEALFKVMENYNDRNITLVFTLMKDKDVDRIMELVAGSCFNAVYFNRDGERAYHLEERYMATVSGVAGNAGDLSKILERVKDENTLYLFTGSSRLYKTALAFCEMENYS